MKYKVNIRCVQGPDSGNRWQWTFTESTTVVLGRINGCHIRLKDRKVSQSHCLLQIQNGRLCAIDMGSSHCSLVNTRRVEEAYPLKDGDVLTLGNTRLLLQITPLDLPLPPVVVDNQAPKIRQEPALAVKEKQMPQTRSRPVKVISDKTRASQKTGKAALSSLYCSFCGTEKQAINRLRACSFCPSCEQIAQFFAKTLPDYRIVNLPWHVSEYGVVVIIEGQRKKKLLYISRVFSPEISLRLREEVEEAAKNGHQNLYPIVKKHEHKERFLAFLPYLPGIFASRLQDLLSPIRAIDTIIAIGKALEYGTRRWGHHGEICPANIYLEITGRPYLFGYGVLRRVHLPASKPTIGGLEPEIANFRAPERQQFPPTLASDIFSLVASLFTLLSGETLRLERSEQTKDAVSFSPPHNYFRQPLLDNFFQAALAHDPTARYPDIPHFLDALAMVRCLYT